MGSIFSSTVAMMFFFPTDASTLLYFRYDSLSREMYSEPRRCFGYIVI